MPAPFCCHSYTFPDSLSVYRAESIKKHYNPVLQIMIFHSPNPHTELDIFVVNDCTVNSRKLGWSTSPHIVLAFRPVFDLGETILSLQKTDTKAFPSGHILATILNVKHFPSVQLF